MFRNEPGGDLLWRHMFKLGDNVDKCRCVLVNEVNISLFQHKVRNLNDRWHFWFLTKVHDVFQLDGCTRDDLCFSMSYPYQTMPISASIKSMVLDKFRGDSQNKSMGYNSICRPRRCSISNVFGYQGREIHRKACDWHCMRATVRIILALAVQGLPAFRKCFLACRNGWFVVIWHWSFIFDGMLFLFIGLIFGSSPANAAGR